MDTFFVDIAAASDGQPTATALRALIASDPALSSVTSWKGPGRPFHAHLYALLVVPSDGIRDDRDARDKIHYASGCGFPIIPVVPSLAGYDFSQAPLIEVAERNAEALDGPDRLRDTLLHHAGLRLFGTGGRLFISYARSDGSTLMEAIRDALLSNGLGHTVDVYEFPGGELIQQEIALHLRAADLAILIDSHGAARSRWVAEETDMALAAHVPVVAVAPQAGAFHHTLEPYHVPWSANGTVVPEVVRTVRRILARTLAFRVRVQRVLSRMARLCDWQLTNYPSSDRWLVTSDRTAELEVACTADRPALEDVVRLRQSAGSRRGLLVAGVRPFQPETMAGLRSLGKRRVSVTSLATMAARIPIVASKRPLKGYRVLLSAAQPSDPDEIERARGALPSFVVSFVQSLLELGGVLVYGGHPSVTPLVHQAMSELTVNKPGKVELHQAQTWRADRTAIAQKVLDGPVYRSVQWHGTGTSPISDLAAMRSAMITSSLIAAVFVGGKTTAYIGDRPGIHEEHARFVAVCPGKPALVVGLAQGAALTIPPSGDSFDDMLRTIADPDLAVALIIARLCGLHGR